MMAEKRLAVSLGTEAVPVGELVFESTRPNSSQFVYDDAWLLEGRPTVSPDLMLLAVDDFSRVGALRFCRQGESPEALEVG